MPKMYYLIIILTTLSCYAKEPVFSFAIFSDNHGEGTDQIEFKRMADWIESNNCSFVLGTGDHVQAKTKNNFIDFLKNNKWWYSNFYPTVADNENGHYGKNQADWGSGVKLFDLTDIKSRKNVKFAENGVEYHAVINEKGLNIHFISLHYPDQPDIDSIAFKESSKEYMVEILKSIDKKENDIVIIGAHSRLGYWLDKLNAEQKKIVNEKADIVLSSTTHVFHIFSENGDAGPLVLNTGSITKPRLWSSAGFISVDVYNDPLEIDVSYIDCSKKILTKPKLFFRAKKEINGRITKF
jgi:predicted phosphodiesterase